MTDHNLVNITNTTIFESFSDEQSSPTTALGLNTININNSKFINNDSPIKASKVGNFYLLNFNQLKIINSEFFGNSARFIWNISFEFQ
jgi:hypothetical protein